MRARKGRGGNVEIRSAEGAVSVPTNWYERRLKMLGAAEIPAPDNNGDVAAVAYLRASVARELLHRRIQAEATPKELAAAARTRERIIVEVEAGVRSPDPAWLRRLENVLKRWKPRASRK
jgi:hypothetical protein